MADSRDNEAAGGAGGVAAVLVSSSVPASADRCGLGGGGAGQADLGGEDAVGGSEAGGGADQRQGDDAEVAADRGGDKAPVSRIPVVSSPPAAAWASAAPKSR